MQNIVEMPYTAHLRQAVLTYVPITLFLIFCVHLRTMFSDPTLYSSRLLLMSVLK